MISEEAVFISMYIASQQRVTILSVNKNVMSFPAVILQINIKLTFVLHFDTEIMTIMK